MRPLDRNDELFRDGEPRFEALVGTFRCKESRRRAVMIVLTRIGLGRYQRLVPKIDNLDDMDRDLQIVDFNKKFNNTSDPLAAWSVNDVLISNPRPNLPSKSSAGRYYVPVALNCATALRAGVEVGGFWGEEAEAVTTEHTAGQRIYIALLQLSQVGDCFGHSIAFTVRNTKSGKIYGLILAMKDWKTFNVSIEYDLVEKDFKRRHFFDRLLKGHTELESQNLLENVLSYKLGDGSHMFLSCDDQEILSGRSSRKDVQDALEGLDLETASYKEVRDKLTQGTKAQLRVGIIQ
jgi:hypothetical protein